MRLLDEGRVVEPTEQLRRVRNDAVEEIDADREVRAVDERTARLLDCATNLFELRVPARRALHERDARERAGFGVTRHGLGHGEVYLGVVPAEYLGQLFRMELGLARAEHGRNLVAALAREPLDELPHRAAAD